MAAGVAHWQAGAAAAICAAVGAPASAARWSSCPGSSLNATWRLDAGELRSFVKVNSAERAAMFEAEAAGLIELASANAVRVPRPIAVGVAGNASFIALEWVEFAAGGRDAALGHALAALHRRTAAAFGWHRDNTIGTTPQDNARSTDWGEFFRDRRIAPQLCLAARNGYGNALQRDGENLLAAIPALLGGHASVPSLLHGDLWSGNAARLRDGAAVIFDPAVYYGDREADLAMCRLFGGFGADFFAAYREAWPLPPGHELRRELYTLYHVLNHANLFGGGYVAQATAMTGKLLAAAR
jgi:protein-ribulosamine 3-kinase